MMIQTVDIDLDVPVLCTPAQLNRADRRFRKLVEENRALRSQLTEKNSRPMIRPTKAVMRKHRTLRVCRAPVLTDRQWSMVSLLSVVAVVASSLALLVNS